MFKLSILICSLESRSNLLHGLLDNLYHQTRLLPEVEILTNVDGGQKVIGKKRNELLEKASGLYLAMIDDDDTVSDKYVELLLEGIQKGVDCCSLKGIMTTDGKNPEVFEHSIIYSEWATIEAATGEQVKYRRTINHLNCVKSSIAKQFKFPEIRYGEDHVWSKALHASGLLEVEHFIPEVLYYYKYVNNKPK